MKLVTTTIVLDLDGTISDNSIGITRCFNHALRRHGFPAVADDVIAREIGPPLDATFLKIAKGIKPAQVMPLIATYRERYALKGFAENSVYADIPATLATLHNAGIELGVCTAKRQDFAIQILELFKLSHYFSFVSGGDVGISKGDQLAQLLKSRSIDSSAVMVGDRASDITAARQNGLRSVGVLWGFGDYAELSAAAPSCILQRVDELTTITG